MKPIHFSVALVVIILQCLGTGCKKNTQEQPPAGIRHTKGLLATIGINGSGKMDTICFRIGSSGTTYVMTDLSPRARTGGFVEKPRDLVDLTATGSGNWTFINHAGRHFKLGGKENIGGNFTARHNLSFSSHLSDSAQFVANDAGDGTFYIESVLHRGLFLITEAPKVQPPREAHEILRFDPAKKQKWFIVPW